MNSGTSLPPRRTPPKINVGNLYYRGTDSSTAASDDHSSLDGSQLLDGSLLYSEDGSIVMSTRTLLSAILSESSEDEKEELSIVSSGGSPLDREEHSILSADAYFDNHIFTDDDSLSFTLSPTRRAEKNNHDSNSFSDPAVWSNYNKERGKRLAQQLLTRALEQQQMSSLSATKKWLPHFLHRLSSSKSKADDNETVSSDFMEPIRLFSDEWESRARTKLIASELGVNVDRLLQAMDHRMGVLVDDDTCHHSIHLMDDWYAPHYEAYVVQNVRAFQKYLLATVRA